MEWLPVFDTIKFPFGRDFDSSGVIKASDFKAVYNAPNEKAGLEALAELREKWGKKYPYAVSNWENNWEDVSPFFQFPDEVRRIMYDEYNRGTESPVQESHQDKERVPK